VNCHDKPVPVYDLNTAFVAADQVPVTSEQMTIISIVQVPE